MAVCCTLPESSPDSMRTVGGGSGVEQQIAADVRQMYATIDHDAIAASGRKKQTVSA